MSIGNYFDKQKIGLCDLKKYMFKILWIQLLKCEYFLVSLLVWNSKLKIFGLWKRTNTFEDII